MTVRFQLAVAGAILFVTACASGGGGAASRNSSGTSSPEATAATANTPAAETAQRRVRRDANVISAEELREAPQGNLYDLVVALRPQWLRTTGTASVYGSGAVVVYVDGSRIGAPTALRQIPTSQARSIRYFSPTEAQARFGVGHSNGAIQVETGR